MAGHKSGVRVVAAVEATKAALVLAVGLGLFSLMHRDVQTLAEHVVERFHLNPASRYPHIFIDLAGKVGDSKLQLLALGALGYSALHVIEAYGLWLQRRWAEWLTVAVAGVYVPIEVYELWERVTWIRISLLAVNLAIVAYLAGVLWRTRRGAS
jgi:uncharacterized membrane protein (DUF2068 family)